MAGGHFDWDDCTVHSGLGLLFFTKLDHWALTRDTERGWVSTSPEEILWTVEGPPKSLPRHRSRCVPQLNDDDVCILRNPDPMGVV